MVQKRKKWQSVLVCVLAVVLVMSNLPTGMVARAAETSPELKALAYDDLYHYNGIFYGDMYARQADTEGAVAVGGNLEAGQTWHGFDVGGAGPSHWAPGVQIGKYTNPNNYPSLLLGGSLTVKSDQWAYVQIYDGPVVMRNSRTAPNVSNFYAQKGVTYVKDSLVDEFFDMAERVTRSASQSLAQAGGADANVDDFTIWKTLGYSGNYITTVELGGDSYRTAVINVRSGSNVSLNTPSINRSYEDCDLIVFNFPDADGTVTFSGGTLNSMVPFPENQNTSMYARVSEMAGKTVWNIPNASKVVVDGQAIVGMVLAPNADIEGKGGQINGMAIGKSFTTTGGCELHAFTFNRPIFDGDKEPEEEEVFGSVRLIKFAFENGGYTGRNLNGAKFLLEYYDKETGTWETYTGDNPAGEYITAGIGELYATGLPRGDYRLTEIEAPEGYEIMEADPVRLFSIPGDGGRLDYAYSMGNEAIKKLNVKLTKVDIDTRESIGGATFYLYKVVGTELRLANTHTTTSNGLIGGTLTDNTTYYLVEMQAPEGYVLEDRVWQIVVENGDITAYELQFADGQLVDRVEIPPTNKSGNSFEYELENRPQEDEPEYTVIATKQDFYTGTYLYGAEIGLYSSPSASALITSALTNEAGIAVFTGLAAGTYYLREMNPPEGYYNDDPNKEGTWREVTVGMSASELSRVAAQLLTLEKAGAGAEEEDEKGSTAESGGEAGADRQKEEEDGAPEEGAGASDGGSGSSDGAGSEEESREEEKQEPDEGASQAEDASREEESSGDDGDEDDGTADGGEETGEESGGGEGGANEDSTAGAAAEEGGGVDSREDGDGASQTEKPAESASSQESSREGDSGAKERESSQDDTVRYYVAVEGLTDLTGGREAKEESGADAGTSGESGNESGGSGEKEESAKEADASKETESGGGQTLESSREDQEESEKETEASQEESRQDEEAQAGGNGDGASLEEESSREESGDQGGGSQGSGASEREDTSTLDTDKEAPAEKEEDTAPDEEALTLAARMALAAERAAYTAEGMPLVEFHNTPRSGVYIKKVEADTQDQRTIAGVEFSLYKDIRPLDEITGNDISFDYMDMVTVDARQLVQGELLENGMLATGEGGVIQLDQLPAGRYYFVERYAPGYYIPDFPDNVFIVDTEENPTVPVLIRNEPVKGGIKIIKVDSQGGPLPNAEFELYGYNFDRMAGSNWVMLKSGLSTDWNGELELRDLSRGMYKLVETRPPAGYITGGFELEFQIDDSDHLTDNQVIEYPIYITNQTVTANKLALKKVDADTGEPVAGVVFDLYLQTLAETEQDYSFLRQVTDANGLIIKNNVPLGKATIVERTPAEGYAAADRTYVVNIVNEGGTVKLVPEDGADRIEVVTDENGTQVAALLIENKLAQSQDSITLKKVDSNDGEGIAGVEFRVTMEGSNGNQVFSESRTTGQEGTISLEGLTLVSGTLYIEEVNPAGGYLPASGTYQVSVKVENTADGVVTELSDPVGCVISPDGNGFTIEITNTKAVSGGLILRKVDAETGAALPGVTFEFSLQDAEGNELTLSGSPYRTTDDNGLITISNVPSGKATIREVQGAEGYLKNDEAHEVTIEVTGGVARFTELNGCTLIEDENGAHLGIEIQNTKATAGALYLKKIDADTGKPIPGVVFDLTLTGLDGTVYTFEDEVTNSNGLIVKRNIPSGMVTIVEKTPAAGYMPSTDPHSVKVTVGSDGKITLSDPVGCEIFEDGDGIGIAVRNTKAIASTLMLQKVDADTGRPVAGVWFEMSMVDVNDEPIALNGTDGEYVMRKQTNAQGYLTVNNVPSGTATIWEAEAAEGYLLSDERHKVKISVSDEDVELEVLEGSAAITISRSIMGIQIKNTKGKADLTLLKVDDGEPEAALPNVEFDITLTGLDGTVKKWTGADATTGTDGKIRLEEVYSGTVTIVETQPLDGYLPPAGAYSFSLLVDEAGNATLDDLVGVDLLEDGGLGVKIVNVKAIPNELLLRKIDSITGEPLAGAVFDMHLIEKATGDRWQPDDGSLQTTDTNGMIHVEGFGSGRFFIEEIQAPDGYLLSGGTAQVSVEVSVTNNGEVTLSDPIGCTIIRDSNGKGVGVEIANTEATSDALQLMKVDAQSGMGIPGVVFDLYLLDDSGEVRVALENEVTDAGGVITKKNIPSGRVRMVEKTPAPGYLPTAALFEVTVTVNSEGKVTLSDPSPGCEILVDNGGAAVGVKIANTPAASGALMLQKIDADTGEPMEDVQFDFTLVQNNGIRVNYSGKTDRNGIIQISNVASGVATIRETTPAGYVPAGEEYQITVDVDRYGTVTLTDPVGCRIIENGTAVGILITNTKATSGALLLKKIDAETGRAIPGVEFEFTLTAIDGTVYGPITKTTNANGIITIENVPSGHGIIKETKAAWGYLPSDEVYEVDIAVSGEQVVLSGLVGCELYEDGIGIVVENRVAVADSLMLRKIDAETRHPIPGVEFQVEFTPVGKEDEQPVIYNLTTDGQGLIQIENIVSGQVRITEISNKGYLSHNTVYEATIEVLPDGTLTFPALSQSLKVIEASNGTALGIELTNTKARTDGLYLMKIDEDSKQPIAGAVFDITFTDLEGRVYEQKGLVTNENGVIAWDNVPTGTVVITEVAPAPGYQLDNMEYTVRIWVNSESKMGLSTDGKCTLADEGFGVVITNKKATGDLALHKVDAASGEALAGVGFDVYLTDRDGITHEYLNQVTGTDGMITLREVRSGSLRIVEQAPLAGYLPASMEYTATVMVDSDGAVTLSDLEGCKAVAGSTAGIEISNSKATSGALMLRKVDADNGEALAGVVFDLYLTEPDGTLHTFLGERTNAQGIITKQNIPSGQVRIVERRPAVGYLPASSEYEVAVTVDSSGSVTLSDPVGCLILTDNDGATLGIEIENTKATAGALTLRKVDAETGLPIAGVVFDLYLREEGGKTHTFLNQVTDAHGLIVKRNIPSGVATIVERAPAEGYLPAEQDYQVTISVASDGTVVLSNAVGCEILENGMTVGIEITNTPEEEEEETPPPPEETDKPEKSKKPKPKNPDSNKPDTDKEKPETSKPPRVTFPSKKVTIADEDVPLIATLLEIIDVVVPVGFFNPDTGTEHSWKLVVVSLCAIGAGVPLLLTDRKRYKAE